MSYLRMASRHLLVRSEAHQIEHFSRYVGCVSLKQHIETDFSQALDMS